MPLKSSRILRGFKMKILKYFLLALAILILVPIIIFNQNIPAFVYNELEWRARAHYLLAEEVRADVDYLIDIRTGKETPLISDQAKWDKIPEEIEKGLDFADELVDTNQSYASRQEKIPFLSSKYREYHQLKKPGFESYQKYLQIFIEIKDKEHRGFQIARQLDKTNEKFAGSEGQSWEKRFQDMSEADELSHSLIDQAEELYKGRVIDEGYKNYIQLRCQMMIDFYEAITDPELLTNETALAKELEAIGRRTSGIDFDEIVTNWHREILDKPNKEMLDYREFAHKQMLEADEFYRENDLKSDLISKLLSKFSKSYPKNI